MALSTELEAALAHLRACQKALETARRYGLPGRVQFTEQCVLAALSRLWEAQLAERARWQKWSRELVEGLGKNPAAYMAIVDPETMKALRLVGKDGDMVTVRSEPIHALLDRIPADVCDIPIDPRSWVAGDF